MHHYSFFECQQYLINFVCSLNNDVAKPVAAHLMEITGAPIMYVTLRNTFAFAWIHAHLLPGDIIGVWLWHLQYKKVVYETSVSKFLKTWGNDGMEDVGLVNLTSDDVELGVTVFQFNNEEVTYHNKNI